MSLVNFKQGTQSSIDETPVSDGTIYFATDSKEIVVDIPDGERTTFSKVLNPQEITKKEVDEIFAKYDFTEGGGGSSIDFPITIAQGGTNATDAETAWTNLGGGSVGKISLPDVAENKYLSDDGTWKEVQSSSVDEGQFQEIQGSLQEAQAQIASVEQIATEAKQKAEDIDTNVIRLDRDLAVQQQSLSDTQEDIKTINETLDTKLDISDFNKEKLIELIGVFQGATATQDGEPGLVPAAPME